MTSREKKAFSQGLVFFTPKWNQTAKDRRWHVPLAKAGRGPGDPNNVQVLEGSTTSWHTTKCDRQAVGDANLQLQVLGF